MEQEQNELPEAAFDPVHMENVYLEGCRYLGLKVDPSTSLAFPSSANRCHRSGKSNGVELAHQSGYCLSGKYNNCYIYLHPDTETAPKEPEKTRFSPALPAIALPSLKSLPTFEPRLDALKLRLGSLRLSLLLFRLRLLSQMPSRASLKQSLPPLEQNLPKLKESFQSLNLDVDSLKSRIPLSRINPALERFNVQSLRQQDLRLLALPLMMLLILAAAIIWWPPPGGSEQDAVVMGASISKEATASAAVYPQAASAVGQDRPQIAGDIALLDEAADSGVNSQSAAPAAEKDASAAQMRIEALPEPASSIAAIEQIDPRTAVITDESAVEVEHTDARVVESDEQGEEPPAIAPEQLEQAETERVGAEEDAAQASNDAPETAGASSESAATSILPVAAIASIGPSNDEQSLQDLYESPAPLYIYFAPGDEAEVAAMVTEQQPATILGRDGSGEWLLVRVAGGIEGWVNAVESGADILVSNLPAVDGGGGDAPQAPAVAAENATPEADGLPVLSTAVVNTGALNVRSGPGTEYGSIGVVYNKQLVSLLEQPGSNSWVQVRLDDGLQGWLNSNYLILSS